jgi:hypothetical protein
MTNELIKLYGIATDAEAAVLDHLTLRAGIVWHCGCGWHNSATVRSCEDCGAARIEPPA